jgi:hypothetical protein
MIKFLVDAQLSILFEQHAYIELGRDTITVHQ